MSYTSVRVSRSVHVFFFFSSRRRHTRLQGDWSSDVCSSDLEKPRSLNNWAAACSTAWRLASRCCSRSGVPLQGESTEGAARPLPARVPGLGLGRVLVSGLDCFMAAGGPGESPVLATEGGIGRAAGGEK